MTDRQKGIGALAIVLVAWSFSTPVVKYLMPYYDPWTQNFYRYAAGMLTMLPLLMLRLVREPGRLNGRALLRLLVPTVPNIVQQIGWVVALMWIYPALAAFLNKSSVLFAAVMAYFLFPEERWLFRSHRFLGGLAMSLAGTLALALWRPDLDKMQINFGVGLVLVAAAAWACYSVAAKRPAEELGSTVSFAVVCIYSTVVFVPMALAWGDLGHWRAVPWHVNAIMIVSGIFCVGLAHTLYFYAIKKLSVSVCATMMLMTPLGSMALSRWMFGERLTGGQWAGGVMLLAGGALTLFAKEKPLPAELTQAVEI
jgi:drug/metabolite transporter (DMT)-like permease